MALLCTARTSQPAAGMRRRASAQRPSHPQSALYVERRDIVFYNIAPQIVRIEVTVHNGGTTASAPTDLEVQWAEFGAFLPWSPLTTVPVPAIEAGGHETVSTDVHAAQLGAFGDLDRSLSFGGSSRPPRLLRAPADSPDERPAEDRRRIVPSFNRRQAQMLRHIAWLQGRTAHWVGNINVFVGRRAVERHMARAVRLHPGCCNKAAFMVGGGAGEWYAFALQGPLCEFSSLMQATCEKVVPGAWTQVAHRYVELIVDVPADCRFGELAVRVRRKSTAEEAVVEFSLDATAAGPGCYVV